MSLITDAGVPAYLRSLDCDRAEWPSDLVSSSLEAPMAIDELIVMSAQSDPELLKVEVDAHRRAIGSISGPNGITSSPLRWSDCNIGPCVCASARVDDHGLYNLVSSITDAGVPAYLKSLVNGADAEDDLGCGVEEWRRGDYCQ